MRTPVIIVGAGPAGSSAAAALARRGRDVLVLDRAEFPRDKPCGDGIPPGTVGILQDLGMADAIRAAGYYPIRSVRFVSPRGRLWQASFAARRSGAEFYVAPRIGLDELIRRHALSCGASFRRANVREPIVQHGRVVGVRAQIDGREEEIPACVVIGADGATSAIARCLGNARAREAHRAVAVRAYVEGIATLPHTVELHFGAAYAPGYAWIFPLGPDRANVGVITRADAFKRRGRGLDDLLDDFLTDPSVSGRLSSGAIVRDMATWQLAYATPHPVQRVFDGALLVGDAGRFVDPLTGEGIHNALVSATIAADVVDRSLARGDFSREALSEFDRRCEDALGRLVRRSYALQKRAAAFPFLLDAMFIVAGVGHRRVARWINRVSTDFVVHN